MEKGLLAALLIVWFVSALLFLLGYWELKREENKKHI